MRRIANTALLWVGLAMCLVSLQGCDCGFLYKCDDNPVLIQKPELIGRWHCIRVNGGIAGIDSNVSHLNWFLSLNGDHSFKEEQSGTQVASGTYTLLQETGNIYTIRFSNNSQEQTIHYRSDTLTLSEPVADGLSRTFLRTN